jgi:hypothetical protein
VNGILWAVLGSAIGLLLPVLFRAWQRSGSGTDAESDEPARHLAPNRTTTGRLPASRQPPPGLNRKLSRKFHGVSIKPCAQSCSAVEGLSGQRFLPGEAPALPLPGCDQSHCQCAYSHHGDRRDREDRRSGWGTFGGFTPSIPGGNRRGGGRDRRS